MAGDSAKLFIEVQADIAGATKGLDALDKRIAGVGGVGTSATGVAGLNPSTAMPTPASTAAAAITRVPTRRHAGACWSAGIASSCMNCWRRW